ncbi:MAG: hypothetical protein L0Y56_03315 [Nitrospira sp.]|nr:hypothetical protein [Nitrospira sp.]
MDEQARICPTAVKFLGILGIAIGTSLALSGIATMIGVFSQIPSARNPQALFTFWLAVTRYLILGLAGIVLGVGLLDGKRWAWFGALVLSMIAFLKFPTGTLIGVIVVFSLFRSDVRGFFHIGMPSQPPKP